METQKSIQRYLLIAIGIVLVIGAAVRYAFFIEKAGDDAGGGSPMAQTGTSSQSTAGQANGEKELGTQESNVPDFPVLQRPVVFSSVFSDEARTLMLKKIDASIAALEKDPRVFDEWMNLAILRKTVDDYEGAREIWEFLTVVNPKNQGPYANLAALYAFELKDPVRAEKNFTIALGLWKKDTTVWRNAYEFYRYVQKNDVRAKEILENGIKETQSPDLQYLLDHYGEL